jgi:hypothetical protein
MKTLYEPKLYEIRKMKRKAGLAMQPRGFWDTFVRLAAIIGLAFGLVWSLVFSLAMGLEFGEVFRLAGIRGGAAVGLLTGFVLAFLMKGVAISESYEDKRAFLARLDVALAAIGYYPQLQTESFMTYKPSSFEAWLLAGSISVRIEETSCTIVGPKIIIKRLRERLKEEKPHA